MKSKKVVAALCAAFVILSGVIPNMPVFDNKDVENIKNTHVYAAVTNTAEAVLNSETPAKNGFSVVETGTDKVPQIAERGGEECWLMDKLQGNVKSTINFTLDKSMKSDTFDGSIYDIEVDYYDSGKGYFVLYYNNTDDYLEPNNITDTAATNAWKTAKFTLSDAMFNGKANGAYDFYLSIKAQVSNSQGISSESIGIKRVKVTRHKNVNKLYVKATTDEAGNTFSWFDKEKMIKTTVQNLSGIDTSAEMTFRAVTDSGFVKGEVTKNVNIKKDETQEINIDFGSVDYCDMYYLEVETKLQDGTTFIQRPTMFVIVKTDPDGKRGNLYVAAHLDRYNQESVAEGAELINKANFIGVRESGSEEVYKNVIPHMKNNNLEYLPIVWCLPGSAVSPSGPENWWAEVPHNEAQYAAWRTKAQSVVEMFKDVTDRYEIWNEVNWPAFNRFVNEDRGDDFTEVVRIAEEVINEIDPGAKVGAFGLANMDIHYKDSANSGAAYYEEALEAGVADYIDAVSVHPYIFQAPERQVTVLDSLEWYKDSIVSRGNPNGEVWNTEVGLTTADKFVSTDRRQGAYNARQQLLYHMQNCATISVIYNFERKGQIHSDREDMFGMVGPGYDNTKMYGKRYFPKEGYLMLAAYNYLIGDTEPDKEIKLENEENRVYVFDSEKFGKKVMSLHNINNVNSSISLDLGTDKVEFYDSVGNMTEVYGTNGCYTFDVDEAPVYVVGDFKDVKETKNSIIKESSVNIDAPFGEVFKLEIETQTDGDLKLEVESNACAEFVANEKDGNNVIAKVQNKAEIGEEYNVVTKLKNGDKTVYVRTYNVTSSIPLNVTMNADPASEDYYTWNGVIKIKNISSDKALTGHIEFKDSELTKNLKNMDIGLIPGKTTGLVEVNLGRILKKGIYPLMFDLVTDDGNRYSFSNTFDMSFAKYAENKPIIDGKLDENEWSFGTAMIVDSKSSIKQITDWRGTEDLSAKSMVMWDEDNMYYAAEVTDDVHTQAEAGQYQWRGDDIQLGLYYGSSGLVVIGQGSTSYHEIGLADTVEGPQVWRWSAQDNSLSTGMVDGIELKVTREDGKTYYEAKLPWKLILKEGQQPKEGHQISFNFIINDNDGTGRRGWMEYTPGIGETKNTELFSTLKLLPKGK